MHDDTHRPALGHVVAALAVAAALVARFLLDPVLGDHLPYVTFFVAVVVATWFGGPGPGLVATGLGLLLAWYFFVPTRLSLLGATGPGLVGLAAYLTVSLAITGFGEAMRAARRRARRDQQAAREQREWLRTTLASIGDAVVTTDAGGRVALVNEAAQDFTGWTREEAVGLPLDAVIRVINEQTRQAVENPVQRVLREGRAVGPADHTVLVRKDGTERPVDDSAAPIRDAEGRVTGVVLIFRDVTERRRLEQSQRDLQGQLERQVLEEQAARRAAEDAGRQVRASEERLRLFVEHTPAAVAILDRDMRYLLVSRRRLRDYGLEGRDVIGRSYYEVFPDVPERWKDVHRRCLAGAEERCEEDHFVRPDGQEVWLHWEICPWRDQRGEVGGVIIFSEVITDRKHAQEALRASEQRFRTLTAHAPAGIYQTDAAGDCLFVNEKWCALAGLTPEQARGQGWAAALHPDDRDRVFREWYAAVRAGREFAGEYRFRTPQGRVSWVQGSAVALRDDAGVVTGHIGTVADITDRRRVEEALREADRLKDEFVAMLAHELRNPLAPIRNALHIMKQPGAEGAVAHRMREMAERQVQHMSRLLEDLLDVSRISRGRIELRREPVDVAGVVGRTVEAVRPLAEERRHDLAVSLPAGPLRVEADPARLEQVLTNLLNNAAKYTDPGGQIRLTAAREGGEVVVRVRDTGIGIAPEMLPKVFDLFVQAERRVDRSQGGVGIGLTLVKRLVEMHGGSIGAHSAGPGRGSEFVVRLPALADGADGGRGGAPDAEAPALPHRRVLVVDDSRDAADSLALLLRLAGQDVRVAYDGPSALAVARQFRAELVFLDIGMPGMDGYEVAARLRQQPGSEDVVLVAVTGWGQEDDRRRGREAGFDGHAVKPAEPDSLRQFFAHPRLTRRPT